jgi:hypothetical protein
MILAFPLALRQAVGLLQVPLLLHSFVTLRNGYAALRIPNAEMRKKLKNPLSELALQSKGICFLV